jgi:succinoglycan biosynthesis transport protein ExoP
MSLDHPTTHRPISFGRAVRHHLVLVTVCLALGAVAGWLYAGSAPATYTSNARVLINPSVGNPFAPTPASVRQDELTSLATEAQVAKSAEVLDAVTSQFPGISTGELQRGLQITVPPNTQILEISYSATDSAAAQLVTDAVASAYLENRSRRFDEVTAERVDRVEVQTLRVVKDLRTATGAAQQGTQANRQFQSELATALRNELVSLRAQRTALENSESPPGAVISPASTPAGAGALSSLVMPVAGGLSGLALGCLLALLLERLRGVVRSPRDVEAAGLPVVAAVPPPSRRARLSRRGTTEAFDITVRRLRATMLDLEPRPDVVAVSAAGGGESAAVSEAIAQSFAKAGHRVVLVLADEDARTVGLGMEDGLAQALLHEKLNVMDLLQPSVEPLLSLLPPGRSTDQSRELFAADRVRSVLSPLIEAGHLVVIQAPGIDTAEGEAVVGASDWGLVVVTTGGTRPGDVERVTTQVRARGAVLAAMVVSRRDLKVLARRTAGREWRRGHDGSDERADGASATTKGLVKHDRQTRSRP